MSSFPLCHLDASIWQQIAPHLEARDILRLIFTGSPILASKINKGARHFAFDNSCTKDFAYPDLLRVFSLAERLCSSVESFSFQSRCPTELVWSCNWVFYRPSFANLRHLSLQFFGSVAAVFSQTGFCTAFPALETLHLVDEIQNTRASRSFQPLKFGLLPPSLRVLRILSQHSVSLNPLKMDKLPPNLETLHLSALILFKKTGDFAPLRVPETLTDLVISTGDASRWIIKFSELPPHMTRFELLGPASTDEQVDGKTCVFLEGIERIPSLHTLIMENCTIYAPQLEKIPSTVTHLECDLIDDPDVPTPKPSCLRSLRNFTVRADGSSLTRAVLGTECSFQNLHWFRTIPSNVVLPTSITSFYARVVEPSSLPASLTSLTCYNLVVPLSHPSSSDSSPQRAAELPKTLAQLYVMASLGAQTIEILPSSLTHLNTILTPSRWSLLSEHCEKGHLPLLKVLITEGDLPWHLLGTTPTSLETLSFTAGEYPVDAGQLRALSMIAKLHHLRTLTISRFVKYEKSSSGLDCGELEIAACRLFFASLPPSITSLDVKATSSVLPKDVFWPQSLRYLALQFHSSSHGDASSYLTEDGRITPTLATLPNDLISLQIAMDLNRAGSADLFTRPEFPQNLSWLDHYGGSSRYYLHQAKKSPHVRLGSYDAVEKVFFSFSDYLD